MVMWADIEGNPENNDDLMDLFDGKSNKIVDRKDLNGNYTLQEEDEDHLLVMTHEGDVTVPADELPVNSAVVLTKSTGDDVNIIAGSGVTFLPTAGGYVIPEEWIFITLFHASENTWVLQGTVSDDLQSLLDEKAEKKGDPAQTFEVAAAQASNQAVRLSQLGDQNLSVRQLVRGEESTTYEIKFNDGGGALVMFSWGFTSGGQAGRRMLRIFAIAGLSHHGTQETPDIEHLVNMTSSNITATGQLQIATPAQGTVRLTKTAGNNSSNGRLTIRVLTGNPQGFSMNQIS